MNHYLLIINAGSSSIKIALYRVVDNQELVADVSGQLDGIGTQPAFKVVDASGNTLFKRELTLAEASVHSQALIILKAWWESYLNEGRIVAVGHRVVHGGTQFSAPVRVDTLILAELKKLISLAPLHQPHNLAPIQILLETMPDVPQVACFDTAFHNTQPAVAKQLAIPRRFSDAGICRYGFHGLSYEYIVSVLPNVDPGLLNAKIVIAHLGNGSSLCALRNGRSIATTMGFSPLDGLVMGSRCGNLDPGVLLHLMDHYQMDARALEKMLYYRSGLLGVSGISSDMRILLENDSPSAQETIDLFVYRAVRELGSLAAALGGLDALIFTGGIGEHAASIREKICYGMAWLGLELNASANAGSSTCISMPGAKLSAWVIPTDENRMIARHTLRCCVL